MLAAASCGDDDGGGDALQTDVIEHYADGVHQSYAASLTSAKEMDTAVDAFVADPTDATLQTAKDGWLAARDDYGPTEAFRFYGGPIDDVEDGPEGLINAWPLDEAYIDYVDGDAKAGVINDPEQYPTIDAELLTSLNEQGGEANISTGWHAVEFLLWGQDLDENDPGKRPVTDYTTADNAERRGQYLTVASDLLIEHLQTLVDAWAPDEDNYRAEFVELEPNEALTNIITGIGTLSKGELAGERMNVAYTERSEEDEHSCFSDNTTADIVGNAQGIANVLTGDYPGAEEGPGLYDLFADADEELTEQLRGEAEAALDDAGSIEAPFDQYLREGVPDDDPGRVAILDTIEALETQADTIVALAEQLDISVSTEV